MFRAALMLFRIFAAERLPKTKLVTPGVSRMKRMFVSRPPSVFR